MYQKIKLREDSDDDGEWPNTASVPPLPLSRKRGISNVFHPCNENVPGGKTVTNSAEFVADLELADEVEVSPHNKKRCGVVKIQSSGNIDAAENFAQIVVKSEPSVKNDAAENSAQNLKGDHATENDDGSEDGEIAEHPESPEGMAVAVSHPMSLDSEQTRGYDGCAGRHSHKVPTFKPPSNASGRHGKVA